MQRFPKALLAMSLFRFGVLATLFLAPFVIDDRGTYYSRPGGFALLFVAAITFIVVETLGHRERLKDFTDGRDYEDRLRETNPDLSYAGIRDRVRRSTLTGEVSPVGPPRAIIFGTLLGVGLAVTFRAAFAAENRNNAFIVVAAAAGAMLGPLIEGLLIQPIFRLLFQDIYHYGRLARMKRMNLKLKDLQPAASERHLAQNS